jgi:hypothetical protein
VRAAAAGGWVKGDIARDRDAGDGMMRDGGPMCR